MYIQAEFNPTVLINILVGAAGVTSKRNPGPILTSIRKDLRNEIEKALPVFYLWDAKVIVESMLEALDPGVPSANRTLDLSKYLTNVRTSDSLSAFYTYERNEKTKKISIREEADSDTLSIYSEKYKRLLSTKTSIIGRVHRAILTSIPGYVDVDVVVDSIVAKQEQLSKVLAEIYSLGVPTNTLQNNRFTKVIRAAGRDIKSSVSGNRIVLNADKLITDYSKEHQVLIVSANFNISKKIINDKITDTLTNILKRFGIGISTKSTGFKAGNFSAAGHSGFISDNLQGINTPQIQAATMMMAMSGKDDPGLINRFISGTDHSKWLFKIDKEYGSKVQKVLSLGISLVRSQPSNFNSAVLSSQESMVVDAEMKSILNSSYKDALAYMQQQAATNKDFHTYLVSTFRMSPTLAEGAAIAILDAILGKTSPSSKKGKLGTASPNLGSVPILPSVALKKVNLPSITKKTSSKVKIPPKAPTQTSQVNLSSLMVLINRHLQSVISANMGDGAEHKILNYRTGRFAASARVERMSESRAGMITAWYSYMKNPYQTFEPGFNQGSPASRDPKLLISKSIREIAATRVGARLRAVSA